MRNYMETDWKYGIKINHHLSTIVWSENLYIRVTALICQVQRRYRRQPVSKFYALSLYTLITKH